MMLMIFVVTTGAAFGQLKEKDGKKYRYYSDNKAFLGVSGHFEIIDVGRIVVYSQPGFYKTANKTFYYFSLTLDSPIHPLSLRQLRRVLKCDDEELLKELRANRRRLVEKEGRHLVVNELLIENES